MSEPNAAVDATAQTTNTENAEDKSLAFSSMEDPKTGQEPPKADDAVVEGDADGEPGKVEEVDYNQLKTPEGFELDKEVMAQVSPILKELNCSKDKAEKIVAAGAEIFNRAIKGQAEAFAKKVAEWEQEVKADAVLGKEENIAIANRALKEFGDERLTNEIIKAGLGNHPAFVRFCHEVGKAMGEDQVVTATGSAKATNRNDLGEPMLDFKGM